MKSSAMHRLCPSRSLRAPPARRGPKRVGSSLDARDGCGSSPQHAFVCDPREDEDSTRDLERAKALAEQDEREEDGEERLQVREEGRSRGPDSVDRGEPEDVREEESPDDRVAEAEPHLPAEGEGLVP